MSMLSVEQIVIRILEKHCDNTIDIKTRIRVISDLFKYKPDDVYIWSQKKGKVVKYYTVYFDDEFVCGFDEGDHPDAFLLEFWKGLKKLVKENKVILNKFRAEQRRIDEAVAEKAKKQAKLDRLNKLPDSTPEEKMAKEVVKRVSRSKKKHPSTLAARPNA